MRQSETERDTGDLGYRGWFAFWIPLAFLALLAVWGAFVASAGREPGDYVCGLTLSGAAILLGFMLIKQRFDGRPADWGGFLLVDEPASLIAVIVVFVIVALVGIFVAAGLGHGALHDAGIALAVASALAVFLSMKRVFDNLDRGGR